MILTAYMIKIPAQQFHNNQNKAKDLKTQKFQETKQERREGRESDIGIIESKFFTKK